MKFPKCLDCKWSKLEYQHVMGPAGPGVAKVFFCINPEYGDPIHGEPMECRFVRNHERFCGLAGEGFEPRGANDQPREESPIEGEKSTVIVTER